MSDRGAVRRCTALIVVPLVAVAACKPAETAKQSQPATSAAPGGLAPLTKYLVELLATPNEFEAYVAAAETQTPLQNAHTIPIRKVDPQCTGPTPKLTFASYATSGSYSYPDLTDVSNQANHGYAVAEISNDSRCLPISVPIPANGTAIVFIAQSKPKTSTDPVSVWLFVVDRATATIVDSLPFQSCEPGVHHPWYGDHALAKKRGTECYHDDPSKPPAPNVAKSAATAGSDARPQIDDPWALWISCAADCCYADPGTRGEGRGDSTHTDTTHRDTTHRDTTHKP